MANRDQNKVRPRPATRDLRLLPGVDVGAARQRGQPHRAAAANRGPLPGAGVDPHRAVRRGRRLGLGAVCQTTAGRQTDPPAAARRYRDRPKARPRFPQCARRLVGDRRLQGAPDPFVALGPRRRLQRQRHLRADADRPGRGRAIRAHPPRRAHPRCQSRAAPHRPPPGRHQAVRLAAWAARRQGHRTRAPFRPGGAEGDSRNRPAARRGRDPDGDQTGAGRAPDQAVAQTIANICERAKLVAAA